MDNSFKGQGEFKPDGEFKPQGEFNKEEEKIFVNVPPATAIKFPYEKSTKTSLLFVLIGFISFALLVALSIPAVTNFFSAVYKTILSVFAAISVLCFFVGLVLALKGVKGKDKRSIFSFAVSLIFLVASVVIFLVKFL